MFEDLHRPLGAAGFRGAIRVLIVTTGALFFLQQVVGGSWPYVLGLVPARVVEHLWLWQPLTYTFLHGGLFHWLFNMFVLWMFGRELEIRWGTPFFLFYYFLCGAGAATLSIAIAPHSTIPIIGASGAIYGVLTAFGMTFPEATLYLYFFIPLKAWQAVLLFGLIEFLASLPHHGGGLSSLAHLGGMATGFFFLRYRWRLENWGELLKQKIPAFTRVTRGQRKAPGERFHDLSQEVDRILDKILREGANSLTDEERTIMERYSKERH